jgi:hypothetical protein
MTEPMRPAGWKLRTLSVLVLDQVLAEPADERAGFAAAGISSPHRSRIRV